MPRLLLVDDNPSIHKIAETLLATTDIDLVCVESADAALKRIHAGEAFDVALVDTAMAGMDGWALLERLRAEPATARMPIAMMAGVLDTVDPERVQKAPIQGFLKKPVELRDLGGRVQALMATPVPEPEPAPAVDPEPGPAAPSGLSLAEADTRPGVPEPPSPLATLPATPLADLIPGDADLLVLGPEDLLVAEAPAEALSPLDSLDLEDLDLDALRGLPAEAEAPAPGPPVDAWAEEAWERATPVLPLPDPAPALDTAVVTADDLPDLGDLVAATEAPTQTLEPAPEAQGLELDAHTPPPPPPDIDISRGAALAAGAGLAVGAAAVAAVALASASAAPQSAASEPAAPQPAAPQPAAPQPATPQPAAPHSAAPQPAAPEPEAPPALEAPAAAAQAEPAAPAAPAQSAPANPMLEALLQDPAALDALARAVAARLSDRALKEVAWEVLPELAERLKG